VYRKVALPWRGEIAGECFVANSNNTAHQVPRHGIRALLQALVDEQRMVKGSAVALHASGFDGEHSRQRFIRLRPAYRDSLGAGFRVLRAGLETLPPAPP